VLAENEAMLGLLRRKFPVQWNRRHGPAMTVVCPLDVSAIELTTEDLLPGAA
jgi:hypothetical protein